MRTSIHSLSLAIIACLTIGCSGTGSSDPSQAITQSNNVSPTDKTAKNGFVPKRPAQSYEDPRLTVQDFLTSVKSGDDQTATALLSTVAQEEAWKNGMAISADGFPAARFDVSEVEYLNENKEAHVMSVWSDATPYGETKTFRCVWLLRREPHGWCVYGMSTKFLESMDPIELNFENQADMQKKQRWAEQQIAQHLERQQPQVQGPPVQQATHTTPGQQLR